MYFTTSSVKKSRPTLSWFRSAVNISTAATSTAVSILLRRNEPNAPDAEMSTARITVSSRSSQNVLTNGDPGAGRDVPVDRPDLVAGDVFADGVELHPTPFEDAQVLAGEQVVHLSAGDDLDPPDFLQDVFKLSSGHGSGYQGTGTDSSTLRTTSSGVVSSASAS